jgi:hypothetical protein
MSTTDTADTQIKSELLATKADYQRAVSSLVRWIVGTAVATFTVAFAVMLLVLNSATHATLTTEPAHAVAKVQSRTAGQGEKQ